MEWKTGKTPQVVSIWGPKPIESRWIIYPSILKGLSKAKKARALKSQLRKGHTDVGLHLLLRSQSTFRDSLPRALHGTPSFTDTIQVGLWNAQETSCQFEPSAYGRRSWALDRIPIWRCGPIPNCIHLRTIDKHSRLLSASRISIWRLDPFPIISIYAWLTDTPERSQLSKAWS